MLAFIIVLLVLSMINDHDKVNKITENDRFQFN